MPGIVTSVPEAPSLGSRGSNDQNPTLSKLGYREATDPTFVTDQAMLTINEWRPWTEVFWLKNGPLVSAVMAGLTAIPVFNSIRAATYKIQKPGRSLSNVIVVPPMGRHAKAVGSIAIVIPYVVTNLTHRFSLQGVFTQDPPCAPCREIRAISLQVATGALWPTIMAFFGANYAVQMETGRPIFAKGQAWTWLTKALGHSKGTILGAMAFNALGMAAVHHFQEMEWINMNVSILRMVKEEAKPLS